MAVHRLLLQLASLAALALSLLLTNADAYGLSPSSIYPVPETDRVSANQLYAKDIAILPPAQPLNYIQLFLDSKSSATRVFISYVDKKNGSTSSNATFGNIKVSGSSVDAVDYVMVGSESFEDIFIQYRNSHGTPNGLAPTDAVLVEVELFQKQSLNWLNFAGEGEVVVLDNVLRAPRAGDIVNNTLIMLHTGSDNTSIFVVDPKNTISTGRFDIQAYSRGSASNIQVEVAGFNVTKGMSVMYSYHQHDVALFADQFVNDVAMIVDEPLATGSTLCVASKTPVNVTTQAMIGNKNPVDSVRPAGSQCVKQPIPERVPVFVSPSSAASATTQPSASAKSSSTSLQSAWNLATVAVLISNLTLI